MPYRPNNAGSKNAAVPMNRARETNGNTDDEEELGGTNLLDILALPKGNLHDCRPDLTDRDSAAAVPSMTSSAAAQPAPSYLRQSQLSANLADAQHAALKPNFTSRRRQSSIPKIPMGPRPLDYAGGKRYAVYSLAPDLLTDSFLFRSVSNSIASNYDTVRGPSGIPSHDPYANELSINDISRFSFASIIPRQSHESEDPIDFLEPSFNFDDFHDHITTTEPNLNNFPLPGGAGIRPVTNDRQPPPQQQRKSVLQPAVPIPTRKASATPTASTTTTPAPILPPTLPRKSSTASNASKLSTKSDSMAQTATQTQSILKGRRQSQFPPNSFNNSPVVKAPRKSIGPGTFVPPDGQEGAETVKRRPSTSRKTSSESKTESKSGLSLRLMNRKKDNKDEVKTTRAQKAKSFLASKSQSSNDLLTPSKTPDLGRPVSSHTPQTPNRRSGTPGRTTTPGANNKRMSVMPSHASGLGARTISPTDARRMKRMSMVPPAPPLPHSRISQAPPTPQPEPMPMRPHSTAHSPVAASRKSLTPSSSRTTPDPNRKSYSSGQSLSSATSFGSSVRNSASLNARLSQTINSSRLPTPKPRIDTAAANAEFEVPPVPAIPKAYESPGSELDQPYFSARSSSLPPVDTPISASPLITTFADAMKALETPRAPSSSSRLSNFQAETEPKQKPQPKPAKKGLGARLPPLNLLPLSTPTAAKIKAFKDARIEVADPPLTPPATRNNLKTPSTPMTASKASFFSRGSKGTEDQVMRSNTSHFTSRPDPLRSGDDSPILPVFSFESDPTQDRNLSPFTSSSLPKTNDFANYMRPNFGTAELNRSTQPKPNGPRAPSFSITPKLQNESPVEKPSSSDSSFSGLRRKLSRKKVEPKVEAAEPEDPGKFDNMPPPKLPASATWSNNLSSAASPVQKPAYLKSRRQTSGSSHQPERQESFDSAVTHLSSRPSVESSRSIMMHSNRSGSISQTVQQPRPVLKSQEPPLDRDDMIAEEEMKKLASKRRDFESAARELDALRVRACPARRMSANTAAALHNLNIFERGEIIDFPDIFFVGSKHARKIVGDPNAASTNFGYDDERGDYNIIEGDHLAYRYEVVDLLGKGSFGQVVRCIDHKTGILVAVKIIRNKKRFHQQALVEVNILQKLKQWVSPVRSPLSRSLTYLQDPQKKHSVVDFDQSFYFRGHLCISTDLLGMNLYEFIKAHDFRGFSLKLIRRFTKQLLNSLILLHYHKVIHCDLKPENILLAHPVHSEIKVIDFGSSCFEKEKVYTYIQSRFYRSPEVILGMSYGMPIDMWSIGCILAELFTGYPIFPGENEQEQLACIMEVFGPPEKHLIEKSSRKKLFFDSMGKPRLTVSSKGRRRRPSSKDLRQALKCDDEAFLDFITRCLRWDPARRLSPQEASKHEFITGIKATQTSNRRNFASNINTPVRRVNSVTNGARPLPVPPSTTLKVNNGRQDLSAVSPSKGSTRRQSTATGLQIGGSQAKKASNAAISNSSSNPNLSRLTGQRRDLATAAAAASLVK